VKIQLTRGRSIALMTLLVVAGITQSQAAVNPDRTRYIFDGSKKTLTVNVTNHDQQRPFLAQSWIEDIKFNKVTSPFLVQQPIKRLEPGGKEAFVLRYRPEVGSQLPKDRETLFYYNLREIPPVPDKVNSLQIAMQISLKLFYRPAALVAEAEKRKNEGRPWQEEMRIEKRGSRAVLLNPTAFYTVLTGIRLDEHKNSEKFQSIIIAPFSEEKLTIDFLSLGNKPEFSYINDNGFVQLVKFSCHNNACRQ